MIRHHEKLTMNTRKRKTTPIAALPGDVAGALAQALTPIVPRRAAAIKAQVLERIRGDAAPYHTVRAHEGEWQTIAPRVECKRVYGDGVSESYFLRLQPGARLPAHPHAQDELCVVLEGSVRLGEVEVGAGDFHLARAGSSHGVVESVHGALLFIRGAPSTHAHR